MRGKVRVFAVFVAVIGLLASGCAKEGAGKPGYTAAVHFDIKGSSSERRAYNTTAHELFHQLEHQLAGDNMGKSYYWLKEGAADLIGALVAEKVGFQSLEKWKLDQINVLRRAERHVSPQAIIATSYGKWTTLVEENRHPYEMSDLMVIYLMTRTPNGYRAIADYYRLLGQGTANAAAFGQAFGISPDDLVAGFETWFAAVSTQSATVEVIAAPGVSAEYLADFNRGVALTRRFFLDTWGRDLQSMMRFVLVSGKPAFAAAAVREFGVSEAEAQRRTKNSSWWFAGSTTIYDTAAFATERQRIFSVSGSLARRFADEAAPAATLDRLLWLKNGACDLVAASVVEQSGAYSKDQYRRTWLAELKKAGSYPPLADLATADGWRTATEKYKTGTPSRVMQLACLYLADKHGPAAFSAWFKAARETGSAETAFRQVYGLDVAWFNDEFASYLRNKLK